MQSNIEMNDVVLSATHTENNVELKSHEGNTFSFATLFSFDDGWSTLAYASTS